MHAWLALLCLLGLASCNPTPAANTPAPAEAPVVAQAAAIAPAAVSAGGVFFVQPLDATIQFADPKAAGGMPLGAAKMEPWGDPLGTWLPTAWDAGVLTGFTPADPASCQVSVGGAANASTLQDCGGTVGVYLTSADDHTPGCGAFVMATQLYWVAPAQGLRPWTATGGTLHYRFQMQVPAASETAAASPPVANCASRSHIAWQSRFVDTTHPPTPTDNGFELGFGQRVFQLGADDRLTTADLDAHSKRWFLDTPIAADSPWLTLDAESAVNQVATWSGPKVFSYSVSSAQFSAALSYLHGLQPTLAMSLNPADYALLGTGANPEEDSGGGPAMVAASWTGVSVTITP